MTLAVPTSLDDAVRLLDEHPDAMLLAGGTDAMVEINDGHRRPASLVIALNRVSDLRSWRHDADAGTVTIGAGITYTELMEPPLATLLPALAEASRTVGSPQIRNAGTLGGNLGTCSPAGDGLPVLSALDAKVRIVSADGERDASIHDVMLGVKRTSLEPNELIAEITLPVRSGWQGYAKVGVRNAMVIAVASACLAVDETNQSVAIALGSVGPTVIRCTEAEQHLASAVDWDTGVVDHDAIGRVGELVSAASSPITDHRSTAEYRRHAVGVLARRLARRAFTINGVAA
ncbi:FAD binding domain-containing protein [Ilumatobacter nonamiensis]|uniref:FAD binding domain-containing protein n=1 Tax=Ilumatobacter nonamiensis TaxID=467093 RepID=UPI0003471031|nr:FAD binding domain-containing protein [Ilumatobacter nonamiensis]